MIVWRPIRSSKNYKQKRCPFHHSRLECKSRESRDTWINKFRLGVKNKAGKRLIEFCQETVLDIAKTSSNSTRDDYTWTSPDGQHWNEIDYSLCRQRWRSSIQSAKTRLGAGCSSDCELSFCQTQTLKKVGKTTRLFRHDLNQIPYEYTMKVTNRFKGLDLIDRVP